MEELFQLAGLNKLAATSTFGLKVSSIVPESENLSSFVKVETIYEKPSLLYSVHANTSLKPYEKKAVNFYLSSAAPVLRTDIVLISSIYLGTVQIIPSRTELSFDAKVNAYFGTALVCNTSNQDLIATVVGRYESINTHKTVRIDPNSYSVLKEALSVNPLGREILPTLESQERDIPVYSLKASELQSPIKMEVNDVGSSALFSNSPSYLGEAEINNNSFEPKGIEIPTQIYSSAQEAISLDRFLVEIRKYI